MHNIRKPGKNQSIGYVVSPVQGTLNDRSKAKEPLAETSNVKEISLALWR